MQTTKYEIDPLASPKRSHPLPEVSLCGESNFSLTTAEHNLLCCLPLCLGNDRICRARDSGRQQASSGE